MKPKIKTMEQYKRLAIRVALRRNNGNRAASALDLKVGERTVYRYLRIYGSRL